MRNNLAIQSTWPLNDSQMALCHHPRPSVEAPRKYCLFAFSSQCHCCSHLPANWPNRKQLASDPGSQQTLDLKLLPASLPHLLRGAILSYLLFFSPLKSLDAQRMQAKRAGNGRQEGSIGGNLPVLSKTLVTMHPVLCHKRPCLSNSSPGWRQGLGHLSPAHSQHLAHWCRGDV